MTGRSPASVWSLDGGHVSPPFNQSRRSSTVDFPCGFKVRPDAPIPRPAAPAPRQITTCPCANGDRPDAPIKSASQRQVKSSKVPERDFHDLTRPVNNDLTRSESGQPLTSHRATEFYHVSMTTSIRSLLCSESDHVSW
jgi:hypothetical protein